MESSQTLSAGSFSYSWLVNLNPSPDQTPSLDDQYPLSDDHDSNSFIEMDPRMPPSRRFYTNINSDHHDHQDFKFDVPVSPSSDHAFVPAEQLMCNGILMPLSRPQLISSSVAKNMDYSEYCSSSYDCSSSRKGRRLSKNVFEKYLSFLRPLYRRFIKESCKGEKIMVRRCQSVKNWVYSSERCSRTRVADYCVDARRKSCDSECSIHEAVLHCKRSIGK